MGELISIICTLVTIVGIWWLIKYLRGRDKKLQQAQTELKDTKLNLNERFLKVKHKLNCMKPHIEVAKELAKTASSKELAKSEPAKNPTAILRQSNQHIVCAECVLEHKTQIEEYFQHADDLPTSNEPTDLEDGELTNLDAPPKIEIGEFIKQFDNAEDYARHILKAHPESERVEWATEYLKTIGKPEKIIKKVEAPKPIDEDLEART